MLHFFARRMKQMHEKDEKGEKGFTLIELLVVVIIVGILAAIAIPTFLAQRERAQDADAEAELRNVAAAATAYYSDRANGTSYDGMTLETLATDYGYNPGGNTTVNEPAIGDDGQSFTVGATSAASNGFNFDSDRGTVQPDAEGGDDGGGGEA